MAPAMDNSGDDKNHRARRKAAPTFNMSEGDVIVVDTDTSTDDDEDDEIQQVGRSRKNNVSKETDRRVSSRSNKFISSLVEPTDFFLAEPPLPERRRQKASNASPLKSPARRHSQTRRSLPHAEEELSSSDEETDDESSEGASEGDDDNDEPLKIQRILASRSETHKQWKEISHGINTSEIDYGSRWSQDPQGKDEDMFEERFLVKWADLSYLHASWETESDMVDQVDGAKTYLTTFFRKSQGGLLFSADERNDGDYFDPAFTEIDRILDITAPDGYENEKLMSEKESTYDNTSFGMVFDKTDSTFENGTGRQFLIKWKNTPYSDATYEFERDLILCEVEYKDQVKAFLTRRRKPSKREMDLFLRNGQLERRRLENTVFGLEYEELRNAEIEKYQNELHSVVHKNGGQLRDYQAEGVAWMLSNYLENRSSILADEMGLGKTLQTASFVNVLKTKLGRIDPVLVVVPLSTISHWYREFQSWTDLNTIIYHGSAADRDLIRQFEMAYECDRPQAGRSFNQLFLRKCGPRKPNKLESPWMIDVVITTPEMIVADDYAELTAIRWELVVVDEAQKLKNRSAKLAVNLRDDRFRIESKLLLTGTPIQNSVEEFWSLLSVLDSEEFGDQDSFMKAYGDMKSKESVDALHEIIRPYILRRLKEDVEKSVPPKSETLIEVELTVDQKQWYRALYEKNLKFLHKNKKKALDGPGLNNLAMELRKCCNHLFLVNGAEEEFRRENAELSEADHLVKASGKLVLLDKLLPRLKEEGHRILIFSQFKIMLDILEDYLNTRSMKYERIDGSITGNRRQQAIDRFQAPPSEGKVPPFIMMLSTRAGGVGINLTAADTVIIFDSDFNPQNDLQAQARCHRIGQTKTVKVYRLLTRKTYEIQMFHMSSLKMGLDQVVLKGFESNSTGEGALSKDEVERLLRHGAYDIFNEEKAGTSEAESNDFIQSDIDAILDSRGRTVVHGNTGSQSNAAGGTFSKARFTVTAKSPDPNKKCNEDVDIEDPDFWKKMIGESTDTDMDLNLGPRQRKKSNYSEDAYLKNLDLEMVLNASDSGGESASESESDTEFGHGGFEGERLKWGGTNLDQWTKDDADFLVQSLCTHGYSLRKWEDFERFLIFSKTYDLNEIKRMSWSLILTSLVEVAKDEAQSVKKREERLSKQKNDDLHADKENGGILAGSHTRLDDEAVDGLSKKELEKAFNHIWKSVSSWVGQVVHDAVEYASSVKPRDSAMLCRTLEREPPSQASIDDIKLKFAMSVWPSLKTRGWTAIVENEGNSAGKTKYIHVRSGKEFFSVEDVLQSAKNIHPELLGMLDTHLDLIVSNKAESTLSTDKARSEHLLLSEETASITSVSTFLEHYAPLQLVHNRSEPIRSTQKLRLGKRLLSNCTLLHNAWNLVSQAIGSGGEIDLIRLQKMVVIDNKCWAPHPQWSSRHDAVLLYSIWKHGWIEHDSCCRAVSNDRSIQWGAPFNFDESMESSIEQNQIENRKFVDVAVRAAKFLNKESEGLHSGELKGFNTILVAGTYGLMKQRDGGSQNSWMVDLSQLQPEVGLASELPTQKDLGKRAKLILSRMTAVPSKNDTAIDKVDHAFTILDQRDRCNIFLAEVLRTFVKKSATSGTARRLCEIALLEATALSGDESLATEAHGDANPESKEIVKQLYLVKKSLPKGATQAKNVCRVMLGEEPLKPKKATDAVFPSIPASELVFVVGNGSKVLKPCPANASKSAGESSLQKARKRLKDDNLASKITKNSTDLLHLTETESLILSIVCAHGIPEFYNDSMGSNSLPNEKGWQDLGNVFLKTARDKMNASKRKIREAKEEAKDISELLRIESGFLDMEAVAKQALDYASEPEMLAKKVMMLVAKLRQLIVSSFTNHLHSQAFDGLGPTIPAWLDQETINWGSSLDLLDEGKPLGFSAIDFLFDMSDEDRRKIKMVATLDRKGCQDVFCQISLLTHVRSIARKYRGDDLKVHIQKAANNTLQQGETFFEEPSWWFASTDNDRLLFDRLAEVGLTNALLQQFLEEDDTRSTLSILVLQRRANQLARELHMLDVTRLSIEHLEKLHSQRKTEPEKPRSQSGTMMKAKSARAQPAIIDLSGNDSSDDGKRKSLTESPDSSPEKKHRPS